MKADNYPEILALDEIIKKFDVKLSVSNDNFLEDQKSYPLVNLEIGRHSFSLFVDR